MVQKRTLFQNLRTFTFGPPDIVSFTSTDWLETSFAFEEAGGQCAWALKLLKDSTKGMIMCLQAHFIKSLLFSRRRLRGTSDFAT